VIQNMRIYLVCLKNFNLHLSLHRNKATDEKVERQETSLIWNVFPKNFPPRNLPLFPQDPPFAHIEKKEKKKKQLTSSIEDIHMF